MRNPLLRYRVRLRSEEVRLRTTNRYDHEFGIWRDRAGQPLVTTLLAQANHRQLPGTVVTATREGSDQTESASSDGLSTTITKTREGIDQSEAVEGLEFGTVLTFTREGSDQTERSE